MTDKKEEFCLLDIPEGGKCILRGWGALDQEDIHKLTDVGVLLDLPLIVKKVTVSGPIVIAINDAHVAIGSNTARHLIVDIAEEE